MPESRLALSRSRLALLWVAFLALMGLVRWWLMDGPWAAVPVFVSAVAVIVLMLHARRSRSDDHPSRLDLGR